MKPNTCYRVAILCGAAPLVVGIAVFAAWLATRWDWLMFAGALAIYAGLAAFVVGAAYLVGYCVIAGRDPAVGWQAIVWRTTLAAALLLLNFPAAAAMVAIAIDMKVGFCQVECRVEVVNVGSDPLEDVTVSGGGVDVPFGCIHEGRARTRTFWVQEDGAMRLSARQAGRAVAAGVEGYVTRGMHVDKVVVVGPDGAVNVADGEKP